MARALAAMPPELRQQAETAFAQFEALDGLESLAEARSREAWGYGVLISEGFSREDCPTELDLDKRWRLVEQVLRVGVPAHPMDLAFTVVGGVNCGEDLGYGPLRVLTPAEVQAASVELRRVSGEILQERLNAASFPEAHSPYVAEDISALSDYYCSAAERGYGMVQCFS